MPDVFISYTSADSAFAQSVQQQLTAGGVNAFLAENSIEPGTGWTAEVKQAIRTADLVLVLVSRAALAAPWVHNEAGMAFAANRKVIPVVWDMPKSELPGILAHYQALDLVGRSRDEIQQQFEEICRKIHFDKFCGVVVLAAVLYVLTKLG